MRSTLESRLRKLEIEVPGDLAARAKARAAAGPPVRRRGLPGLAAAFALLALAAISANGVVMYFAPRYGQVLAASPIGPITEPLLRASGLGPGDVTAVDQSVTSSGHTIELVAAYADGIQTTIYLQADGEALAAPYRGIGKVLGDRYDAESTLTDQFGRSYSPLGGSGTTMTVFEPLAGPAAAIGARLTLHVHRLWVMQPEPHAGGPWPVPHVDGDWTFHFTLVPRPARELPLPRPVRLGDTTYTFTSVRAASILVVRIRVSGGAEERWNVWNAATANGRITGVPSDVIGPFRTELYDQDGRTQRVGYGGSGGDSINASWVLHGRGRYRLHIGDPQGGADVWFTVPRY